MSKRTEKPAREALVWQGWRLMLPPRWNPVKIEGDHEQGGLVLADLQRLRLGIRWRRLKQRRKFDPGAWASLALRKEMGKLAAEAARPGVGAPDFAGSLLYVDPDPPGRDVFVAFSKLSSRGVELVYENRAGERALEQSLVPELMDLDIKQPMPWSIFGLSCIVPPGLKLLRHQLNAGDLTFDFAGKIAGHRARLIVRQLALASRKLDEKPIERWLRVQEAARRKHYRAEGEAETVEIEATQNRRFVGVCGQSSRKLRFALARQHPARLHTLALHDESRDRLIFLQSSDRELAMGVAATIGWASAP